MGQFSVEITAPPGSLLSGNQQTSLAGTRSARFVPRIGEQAAEWQHVQAELQEGRRLVRVFYGVTAYSPLGQGDRHERAIKSISKAAGWDLTDERYLQIQGLLAAMPLTLADVLGADMERLKRLKTVLSTTAANIAPMQGEYLGSAHPQLLFVGRRGQPFFWSPFENETGIRMGAVRPCKLCNTATKFANFAPFYAPKKLDASALSQMKCPNLRWST